MVNISIYDLKLVKEKGTRYDIAKRISNGDDTYKAVQEIFELSSCSEENVVMLCLDTKNRINGAFTVSVGSLNSSIVHPREVFKRALKANAASIILAHNHPSQESTPSKEDILCTKRIRDCGELLGIALLDHIVVTNSNYESILPKILPQA